MMNCSWMISDNLPYDVIQNIAQGLTAIYIVVINMATIGVTLYAGIFLKCPISTMMVSSHAGNLLGGFSFFLNEIFYSQNGTPPLGCNDGLDRYFLLYLGLMAAMTTLVLNSYQTFNGIAKGVWMVVSRTSTAKTFIVIWVSSTIFAALLILINTSYPGFQFCEVTIFSTIAIIISLFFCIRVLKCLSQTRSNIATVNREVSKKNILRAIFFLKLSVGGYIGLLIAGVTFNVLANYIVERNSKVAMIWLLRGTYAFMFTLEAHMFLYKTSEARKCLMNLFTGCRRFHGDKMSRDETTSTAVTDIPLEDRSNNRIQKQSLLLDK